MKKVIFNSKMDLIKIYEGGFLDQVIEFAEYLKSNNDRWMELLFHFRDYFIDTPMLFNGMYKRKAKYDRSKIAEDPLLEEFVSMSKIYLGAKIPNLKYRPWYDEFIKEENARNFYKTYFGRKCKIYAFINTPEEIIKTNINELIDFYQKYRRVLYFQNDVIEAEDNNVKSINIKKETPINQNDINEVKLAVKDAIAKYRKK